MSRRRIAAVMVAGLVLLGVLFWEFGVPVVKYDLSALGVPGWVVIEYSNPACPALEESWRRRAIRVDESRYVCTSSASFDGWTRSEFRGSSGQNVAEEIRQETTTQVNGCGPRVSAFFYGSEAALVAEYERSKADPTFEDPVHTLVRRHHPECESTGSTGN